MRIGELASLDRMHRDVDRSGLMAGLGAMFKP